MQAVATYSVIGVLATWLTFRFSTRAAGIAMLIAAGLWNIVFALFWVNETTFPDDETLREMGEGLLAIPFLMAVLALLVALVLIVAGIFTKEAHDGRSR